MSIKKKFLKNSSYLSMVALFLGIVLAIAGSVWATSVGNNISVTGTFDVGGNSSLGDASSDTLTVNATSTLAAGVTISAGGLSITAGGLTVANNAKVTGGLGVGTATSTAGSLETSGVGLIGGVLNVSGATQLNSTLGVTAAATLSSTLGVTGLSTLTGGILANNATSTITNLTLINSTSTYGTTTYLAVTSAASTSALRVSNAATLDSTLGVTGAATLSSTLGVTGLSTLSGGILANNATSTIRNLDMLTSTSTSATSTNLYASGNFQVGANGTKITSIVSGFCDFGPIAGAQTIAATSTGTVACTTQAPTGHAANDKVWLTASTTAPGGLSGSNSIVYTGIASSTAAGRIQAMLYNGTGADFTVTTSSWQYFIIK